MLGKYIMTSMYDYSFHQTTRLGNDSCDNSQRNIQNTSYANHMLNNFRPKCPTSDHVEFATGELFMNFKGGNQVSFGGNNINENSMLFLSNLTKPGCKINLNERPFMSVPFLGKGKGNIDVESSILLGNLNTSRKTANHLSEISYKEGNETLLVNTLKNTISNPANLVEGVADKNWIRGGVPSRELSKQKCN
tara:strand:- start:951 stop:1526 length:576 start_codon:yes stop_codon:yes gene_type:complete